jgi:hypothetical protein
VLDLGDRDPAGHGGERVEVAGGGVEDEVAVAVAFPGADEGVVGDNRAFQHELPRASVDVERAGVLRG